MQHPAAAAVWQSSNLNRINMLPFCVMLSPSSCQEPGYQMKGSCGWNQESECLRGTCFIQQICFPGASHCTSAPHKAPFLLLLVRLRAKAQQGDMLVWLCQHNCLWRCNYSKSSLLESPQFKDFLSLNGAFIVKLLKTSFLL